MTQDEIIKRLEQMSALELVEFQDELGRRWWGHNDQSSNEEDQG